MSLFSPDIRLESADGGFYVVLRPLGATISQLWFDGKDVVLGYDTAQAQATCTVHPYFGTIGRVANRIADGTFNLQNQHFTLVKNNGPNSLHGGIIGLDRKEWTVCEQTATSVVFECSSPEGEEGFPLPIRVTVKYSISENELAVEYSAAIDERALTGTETLHETIVNLTTHSYFNLSGLQETTVLNHVAYFPNSHGHMELNSVQIPTGVIVKSGEISSMDFTSQPKTLGESIAEVQEFKGYDHFFLVKDIDEFQQNSLRKEEIVLAASIQCSSSKIKMEMLSNAIGFQLYTANFLESNVAMKSTQGEGFYGQHAGFCLEASAPPDAINSSNENVRASVIVKKGENWRQKTVFRFSKLE